MSEYNGNELNPWLTIWIYPGITMRWIQQKDPATWSSSWPVLPVFFGDSGKRQQVEPGRTHGHSGDPCHGGSPSVVHGHGCIDH